MKVLGIILGVLTAIMGVCCLTMPFRTFLGLGWLMGVLLVVNGVQMIINGLKQTPKSVWTAILGVLILICGGVVLFNGAQRLLTDVMLAYMIGAGILFSGVAQIVAACQQKEIPTSAKVLAIICGVISIILGGLSLAHPFLTMFSAGIMMGAALLVYGINIVVFACTFEKKMAEMGGKTE